MTTSTDLTGRTAVVTGSTSGLGAGIAATLAAAGTHVVITGRTRSRGDEVVARVRSAGGRADFIRADFADPARAAAGVASAASEIFGGVPDILVNNVATLVFPTPTADVTADEISDAFAVSVTAPFLLTGRLAPAMAQRGHGAIVNIGSISALFGASGSALYGATKASVHLLTKSWADEYGPSGVRVNAVAPGPIATERMVEFGDAVNPVLARVPSNRMSTIDEVADAVLFLAGPHASNIHGAILSVDGGFAAV